MDGRRWFKILCAVAFAALGASTYLAWRATDVERMDRVRAEARFDAVRDSLDLEVPILSFEDGRPIRRSAPAASSDVALHNLHVLAYRVTERGLVHVTIPFWFFKFKAPAAQLLLRDTDVDLAELGVSPDELLRYGPGLVLDESRANGDRVLIWSD